MLLWSWNFDLNPIIYSAFLNFEKSQNLNHRIGQYGFKPKNIEDLFKIQNHYVKERLGGLIEKNFIPDF